MITSVSVQGTLLDIIIINDYYCVSSQMERSSRVQYGRLVCVCVHEQKQARKKQKGTVPYGRLVCVSLSVWMTAQWESAKSPSLGSFYPLDMLCSNNNNNHLLHSTVTAVLFGASGRRHV